MKKICFVSWSFIDAGSTTAMNEYCDVLVRRGYDVTIIGRGNKSECKNENNYRVLPVGDAFCKVEKITHLWFLIRSSLYMYKYNFDIVNLFNSPGIATIRALSFFLKAKWIYHIRTSSLHSNMASLIKNHIMRIESYLCNRVAINHKNVATNLYYSKRKISQMVELPNGVNISRFTRSEDRRTELYGEQSKDKTILVSVGILHPTRNLHKMIESYALATQGRSDCMLVIIGDGPDKNHLMDVTHDLGLDSEVFFLGRISYDKISEYMSSADIGLTYIPINNTYNYQPPLKVFEYLQMELPQVATATCIIYDYITDGYNGIIAGDATEDFSAGISRLLNDANLRSAIKSHSIETVKAHTWDNVVDSILIPLYNELSPN